ncbi:MAG: type I methionyl aminopeptidase [bacterium]|nr:type I methionyl aminopeptidase [bacterium]
MIKLKSKSDIDKMREAGRILSATFEEMAKHMKVGANAAQIDDVAREFIRKHGAEPSFMGVPNYHWATCISVNEEIVHGIPYREKEFMPGDICCIDCGVYFKGFHADCARPFLIEPVAEEIKHLAKITEESFFKGAEQAIPGNKMGDVSNALQHHVESAGLTVVKDLYSHGIGENLHEDPLIPNYGKKGKGITLEAGFTFALEPMVNIGVADILTLDDKWTIITADKKWSAHYENTIAVLDDGPEILTIH